MNNDRNREMNSCTGLAGHAGIRSCAYPVAFGLQAWLQLAAQPTEQGTTGNIGSRSGMKVSTK
jgi:hypothetical protein